MIVAVAQRRTSHPARTALCRIDDKIQLHGLALCMLAGGHLHSQNRDNVSERNASRSFPNILPASKVVVARADRRFHQTFLAVNLPPILIKPDTAESLRSLKGTLKLLDRSTGLALEVESVAVE